jgi:hypothetical protein
MLKHNLHEISTKMAIFHADSFVPGDYADWWESNNVVGLTRLFVVDCRGLEYS